MKKTDDPVSRRALSTRLLPAGSAAAAACWAAAQPARQFEKEDPKPRLSIPNSFLIPDPNCWKM